ncbi:unnamed protein product [Medioppia subpectinata]|uniref:Uncharacterized protein n=1 Tax=Medioppia subpectinata TaxID=1979941 RepID=A0A7R9L2R5_9ACAR|nr:unnamed protein product [Medioppia subpectinata]CAG2114492.1 unnamed protein product [Medioppia subpectinata]
MSEHLSKGDSNEVKTSLTELQNRKRLLTQKLVKIQAKSRNLKQKLDNQRMKTSLLNDSNHQLEQHLSSLKAESNELSEKTATLEQQLTGSRDCVQRLRQQLVEKRNQQMIVVDQFNGEIDEMSKDFMRLTIINNRRDIEHKKKAMDEQLEHFRQRKDELLEELRNHHNSRVYHDWPLEHQLLSLRDRQAVPELKEQDKRVNNSHNNEEFQSVTDTPNEEPMNGTAVAADQPIAGIPNAGTLNPGQRMSVRISLGDNVVNVVANVRLEMTSRRLEDGSVVTANTGRVVLSPVSFTEID